MGQVNDTSILYDSSGNYLTWSNFEDGGGPSVLAISNPLSTQVADVDFAENYYGEREFQKAKDVPKDTKIQIRLGFSDRYYIHAIIVQDGEENYGILSPSTPGNDPEKFFYVIQTDKGFKLKSSFNDKYVINQGNFFYAKGDSEEGAYEFQNY
ncbi:hypothetical protein CONCODRAFT_3565 [Conidiobolus coronatus NRRL 28638]|uniref:Uncharacterized protein n=1 Tax=Conidiobolus coronatus (strain ATCC 28846 / CBS 209.66 / NRRL 28638) TaxID=796925 RepID=A0A137PEP3_CONC2|nr:hypothetical protein CONCODRAFT_3565 [Conidiobolus coronatus NRRL 28638]|eukprot:KXN73463.1 hypothetical protein CONCODRAFT_3565 [Conidiobolus coronatus NRRL 28638]